jgi:nucleoside-diphosphate-sugar epimerase
VAVTVFGGTGFVGSEFVSIQHSFNLVSRDNYECPSDNVVYFISTVDNYNIFTDPLLDINTNLVTLVKVLENYRKVYNGGCFNLISSWFVYGKDSGYGDLARGVSEDTECDPKGFYSITKRAAEQLLICYCETYNLNYRILRLANVLGPGDKKVSKKKNAFQYMINEVKENRPIELYDGGLLYRDFIHVKDCARAIDLVINKGNQNEIYNIGNGTPIDIREWVYYAKNKVSSTSKITNIPQKDFHKTVQTSRSFFMDTTKLKNLAYSAKYSMADIVDELTS